MALHHPKPVRVVQPPVRFVEAALCVHSGAYFMTHGRGRPDYVLFRHGYWRSGDAPGNGEGGWAEVDGPYGGGLQFTLGTWNRAAAMSHHRVPHASSTSVIAAQSAATQILAAWYVVESDGGSWREWPVTSRACGLR